MRLTGHYIVFLNQFLIYFFLIKLLYNLIVYPDQLQHLKNEEMIIFVCLNRSLVTYIGFNVFISHDLSASILSNCIFV
jgi:hypothetical protein